MVEKIEISNGCVPNAKHIERLNEVRKYAMNRPKIDRDFLKEHTVIDAPWSFFIKE